LYKKLRDRQIYDLGSIPEGFPKSPAVLGKALRRIAPALAKRGIGFEEAGHTRAGETLRLCLTTGTVRT